mgnify:CR=1 FL=1|jgi:hypothetical protein
MRIVAVATAGCTGSDCRRPTLPPTAAVSCLLDRADYSPLPPLPPATAMRCYPPPPPLRLFAAAVGAAAPTELSALRQKAGSAPAARWLESAGQSQAQSRSAALAAAVVVETGEGAGENRVGGSYPTWRSSRLHRAEVPRRTG